MLILGRLRAADCRLQEVTRFTRMIYSPDGTFRFEIYCEPDPPFPAREEITVLWWEGRDDHPVTVRLPGAGVAGPIEFPSLESVTIPFTLRGERRWIGINVVASTFWLDPNDQPRPLSQMPNFLAGQTPARPPTFSKPPPPWSSIGWLLVGMIAVGGGVWQLIDGKTLTDHFMGGLCAVFFGACMIVPVNEFRRWNRRQ